METKFSRDVYERVNARLKQPMFNISNKDNLKFVLGYLCCLTDLEIKTHGRLTGDFQLGPSHVFKEGEKDEL